MGFDINNIFLPSVGVDMVFNMNSLAPYSRSSIIYDVDYKNKTITIAQPLTPFSKNTAFKELHLTTIVHNKSRRIRVGVSCRPFKLINNYPLANKETVSAVLLSYELPVVETNIRSAFRLPLSTKHIIKGKLVYNNLEYYTSKDFSIRDVSLTGFGIVVPKKRNSQLDSLTKIKINEKVMIGIILVDMDLDEPVGTIPIKAQLNRINPNYSETYSLLGFKFLNLKRDNESILNKFIHTAQIDDLKRLNRRNL